MARPDKDPTKKKGVKTPKKKEVETAVVAVVADPVEEATEVAAPELEEVATAAADDVEAKRKKYPPLEVRPDFRSLPEPEKTLRRVAWISSNEHLTHGEKSTAIAFLLLFENQPDRMQITVSAHLNKETGYSPQVVRAVLEHLEKDWGLMKREIIKKKGTDVELFF